jgi:hypothetical protein
LIPLCYVIGVLALSATDLYSKMVGNLKSGGDDGRYTFIGSENMTQYNLSAKYIIQANHMTLVHHYNDTQNYVLYGDTDSAMSTTVRAFSISKIYGAYCDYGQNYKNLIGYVKGLGQFFSHTLQ